MRKKAAKRCSKEPRYKTLRLSPDSIAWIEKEAERRKATGEADVSHSAIVDQVIAAARNKEIDR